MYFDGACSKEGSSARAILIYLQGKTLKYSFLLQFSCTNNVVEYKALLLGLKLASKHGIKSLKVFGDFEPVVSQVRSRFFTKEKRLRQYRNEVWDTIEAFDAFGIKMDRERKKCQGRFIG